MFCQNCGTNNADGVKFCSNCGNPMPTPKPVEETVVASEPTPVAPAEPVAPAPVYAPVEPVAPAPAPAPEKPKKKNNNIIIIAIVAVIAVIGIVIGVLFATGVIGGDSKKEKTEETTAKKTESTTETKKEEEKKPNVKYAEVQGDGQKWFIALDEVGEPIFTQDGSVVIYETDVNDNFKLDENGNAITGEETFSFILNGVMYTQGGVAKIKVPNGWTCPDDDELFNEKTLTQISIYPFGEDMTTEEVVVELVNDYEAEMGGTYEVEVEPQPIDVLGENGYYACILEYNNDELVYSAEVYACDTEDGVVCFILFADESVRDENFAFLDFLEENVTFN